MNFSATFSQTTKGFDRSKTAASIEELRERVQWVLDNSATPTDAFAALTGELSKWINDKEIDKMLVEWAVRSIVLTAISKFR